MTNELLSLLSFAIGIAAYTVSQKAQHGQLRWSDPKKPFGFWGEHADRRKYKHLNKYHTDEPAFFMSTTWLVFLTDGYHFCQMLAGLFISLSFVPIFGWTYGIAFWILAHIIHALLYKYLSR